MILIVIDRVAKTIRICHSAFYTVIELLQLLSRHHVVHLRYNTGNRGLVPEQSKTAGGDDRARRYRQLGNRLSTL